MRSSSRAVRTLFAVLLAGLSAACVGGAGGARGPEAPSTVAAAELVRASSAAMPPLPSRATIPSRGEDVSTRAEVAFDPALEPTAPSFVRLEAVGAEVFVPADEAELLRPYLVPLVERTYRVLAPRYGTEEAATIRVELHGDRARFVRRVGGRLGYDVDGVAVGSTVVMLSPRGGAAHWGRTLVHELAHAHQSLAGGAHAPAVLLEGLAEQDVLDVHERWGRRPTPSLRFVVDGPLPGAIERVQRALARSRDPHEAGRVYEAATVLAGVLRGRVGDAGVRALLAAYGRGATHAQAFDAVPGGGLLLVETAWVDALVERDRMRGPELPVLPVPTDERGACRGDPCALAIRASDALVEGRLEEARAAATEALALEADEARALYVRGRVALAAGDEGAEAWWRALLAAGLDAYELHVALGRLDALYGRAEQARAHAERAVALDPDRLPAYDLLLRVAAPVRADEARARLVALDPEAEELALARLRELAAREDWFEVDALARELVHAAPMDLELHRAWARAADALDRPDVAARELRLAELLASQGVQEADVGTARSPNARSNAGSSDRRATPGTNP